MPTNPYIQLNRALLKAASPKAASPQDPRPYYVGLVVVDPVRQLVMLGKRREDGLFTGPGGAANPGEPPTQAIIREAFEESGLQIHPHELQELPSRQTADGKICHAYLYFVDSATAHAHNNNDPDRELTEEGWKWYDLHFSPPGDMGPNRLATLVDAKIKVLGSSKAETASESELKALWEALVN